jgi:hypothetical protein
MEVSKGIINNISRYNLLSNTLLSPEVTHVRLIFSCLTTCRSYHPELFPRLLAALK